MANVIEFLESRKLIEQMTHPELRDAVKAPIAFYYGIDPTADSLHIGNLVGLIQAMHFARFGHRPVVLLGGATGAIGDPSGKDKERPLLTMEQIKANVKNIRSIIERFLPSDDPRTAPIFVDNADWYAKMNVIEFLRDVGKQFRVGTMMGKESVRARLNSDEGMSYTEFSYQLLQGYDFVYLLRKHNVVLQIGGSDQYGNITAGTELVRRMEGRPVFGLTYPLLTRSDGKKFGKSEKGAIWIDEAHLSVFEFYQYLIRTPDADVIKFMRALTLMETEEIEVIEKEMVSSSYHPQSAQKRFAEEVTRLVHGEKGVENALKTTAAVTPGKLEFNEDSLNEVAKNMPNIELKMADVIGHSFVEVSVKSGLISSKSEARRLIQNGGAYLNGNKVDDENFVLEKSYLLKNEYLILSAGKKKSLLIRTV